MTRAIASLLMLPLLATASCAGCSRKRAPDPAPPATTATAAPVAAPDEVDELVQRARRAIREGDEPRAIVTFDEAIAKLGVAREHDERRAAVRCELATLLNNRGARLFKSDARAADVDSKRAIELCPGEAALQQNRARLLLARAAGEDRKVSEGRRRARAYLEESVALDGDDADTRTLLGDVLVAEDELAAAVTHLKRALELRPGDARVKAFLDDVEKKAAVEGGFRDNRHNHFIAKFEGYAQERLAWSALDLLEKAYFSVGGSLGIHPREPITVVIYTGDQYKQVVDVPDWASGSFDGKIRLREGTLLAEQGHLERVLRHEYTHAVLSTLPAPPPAWLNEGLAEYFEGSDAGAAVATLRKAGTVASWETLSARSFTGIADGDGARVAYASATALVADLVERRGMYAMQNLMARLAAGEPLEGAFTSTFGVSPRKHYESWVSSLQ